MSPEPGAFRMSTPTILPAIPARRTAQHPLFAAAAVSVIVLSATGVASMTGLIGRPAAQPVALAPQPATPPWIEAPRPVAQAEDPRSWATVESVRTVRTGGDSGLRHGDAVFLTPQPGRMHRFDADGKAMA